MAYEDTKCPCGGHKLPDTMLCSDCEAALADRQELRDYQDPELRVEWRRHAALILCSLARRRLSQRKAA